MPWCSKWRGGLVCSMLVRLLEMSVLEIYVNTICLLLIFRYQYISLLWPIIKRFILVPLFFAIFHLYMFRGCRECFVMSVLKSDWIISFCCWVISNSFLLLNSLFQLWFQSCELVSVWSLFIADPWWICDFPQLEFFLVAFPALFTNCHLHWYDTQFWSLVWSSVVWTCYFVDFFFLSQCSQHCYLKLLGQKNDNIN